MCQGSKIVQEIELLKNLNHPNIIRLYEIFSNKKFVFIVLEYAQKGDLLSYLKKHGKFSEKKFLDVFS